MTRGIVPGYGALVAGDLCDVQAETAWGVAWGGDSGLLWGYAFTVTRRKCVFGHSTADGPVVCGSYEGAVFWIVDCEA